MKLFVYDPENERRAEVLSNLRAYVVDGGTKVHIQVVAPLKSRIQEEKYHAMIADIAKQQTIYGKRRNAESWKRLLLDAFKHETKHDDTLRAEWDRFGDMELLPALNHDGFVAIGEQSRRFTVKLAAAFIEWLHAYGAGTGVKWSAPKNLYNGSET